METKITWIPVEKELPDDDINVLFTDGENVWSGSRDAGVWMIDYAIGSSVCGVTHWAHLPEVPK